MAQKTQRPNANSAVQQYKKTVSTLKAISTVSLLIGIVAIFIGAYALYTAMNYKPSTVMYTSTTTIASQNSTGTLAGIDTPINASELAVINDAPGSYFIQAANMYLNGSIVNPVFPNAPAINTTSLGNQTTVVYLGSITCIYCGENRWAMALALSRFGNFSNLYTGYSSLGDGDVPTLYWSVDSINASTDDLGNSYSSEYVRFVSIEDTHPISGGFALNPLPVIDQNVASSNNHLYIKAMNLVLNLSKSNGTAFQGTPYTIWGNRLFMGADASDFGNSTSFTGLPPLSGMTHAQVFAELSKPNDQFGWTEYAAADIYIASLCASTPRPGAPICSNSAIQALEARL